MSRDERGAGGGSSSNSSSSGYETKHFKGMKPIVFMPTLEPGDDPYLSDRKKRFPDFEIRGLSMNCPVCFEVYRDPRELPCGHIFCCEDLGKIRNGKCPTCKAPFRVDQCKIPSSTFREVYSALEKTCKHEGCSVALPVGERIDLHEASCEEAIVCCPNPGCSEKMRRRDIIAHASTSCEHLIHVDEEGTPSPASRGTKRKMERAPEQQQGGSSTGDAGAAPAPRRSREGGGRTPAAIPPGRFYGRQRRPASGFSLTFIVDLSGS